MIKSLRILAVAMIILSLICCACGIVFSKVAEADRGSKMLSGHTVNGKFVVDDEFVIGANKKGEEAMKAMSVAAYAASGILLLPGIGFAVAAKKKNNTQIAKIYGTVLEKQIRANGYEIVSVEFENGARKKLFVEPPLIVATGDKGILGLKGNVLVEFDKEA